jgi:hypothetical protein
MHQSRPVEDDEHTVGGSEETPLSAELVFGWIKEHRGEFTRCLTVDRVNLLWTTISQFMVNKEAEWDRLQGSQQTPPASQVADNNSIVHQVFQRKNGRPRKLPRGTIAFVHHEDTSSQ